MKSILIDSILGFLLTTSTVFSASTISPEEAINHIGQPATICGNVVSTRFATRSKGQPIFLYLNRPYPNQIFTIIIWGSDRSRFPNIPEVYYKNKRICVSGKIREYNGKPEMVVRRSSQIKEER